MMKRNAEIILRTLTLLVAGILIGVWLSDQNLMGNRFVFNTDDKLSRVMKLVRDNYVDTVNTDSLEGATVNQLLQNLDPHSLYLAPQRATSLRNKLEGGFEGIGVEYQLLQDTLYISHVYPGGPAAKAGLSPGDRIIKLNGSNFSGTHLNAERVSEAFRDVKNDQIEAAVLSYNNPGLKIIKIKRDHVVLSSIDAAYLVAPLTGYIKVSKFAATTDRDFKAALRALQDKGVQKLVLDLRDNGGGYLTAATAIADEFLPGRKLIMFTKGAHEPRTEYFATDSGMFEHGKLTVLINEHSASASEILAGALQDLDRATVVGRRSFGKGLVQQQFPFGDGSAVNLTVARYYTPSGRSIQKSYRGGIENYNNELAVRMQKGELFSAQNNLNDTIFKQPSKFFTAKGRKVFSGGGIMPDVFVPADTTGNTILMAELNQQQLFLSFVLQKLQPTLKKYSNFDSFNKTFNVDDTRQTAFLVYASQTLKEMDSQEIRLSANKIKLFLKATAAGFKWGDEAYYKTLNQDDATLKKAIEVL